MNETFTFIQLQQKNREIKFIIIIRQQGKSETETNVKFSIWIRFDSARLPFDSIGLASLSKIS